MQRGPALYKISQLNFPINSIHTTHRSNSAQTRGKCRACYGTRGLFFPIRTGAKLGSQRPLLFQPSLQVLVKGYRDSPRPGRQPPSDATPGHSQPLSGSRPPCVRLCTFRRGSVGTKSAPNSGRCATLPAAMQQACSTLELAK